MDNTCLSLRNLTKQFGTYRAVDNVNLDIFEGEFITLLGPSGSGKTTCLMMVAGLVEPSGGDILLWGERINDLPAHRRGIGVVFQHYALFPHMTVEDNIAYPLRRRSIPKHEIFEKVENVLRTVQLIGMRTRFPKQLSGGEQQRVALARALVFNPKILLMDEPLGALDRKLRLRLQHEIREIQKQLGVTLLYVTHDQEEAMTMSDRIALMREGHIEQLDAPQMIYEEPSNIFVASFLGETNFLTGNVTQFDSRQVSVELENQTVIRAKTASTKVGQSVTVSIRPEKMHFLLKGKSAENCLEGEVLGRIFIGEIWEYHVRIDSGKEVKLRLPNAPDEYLPGQKEVVRIGWSIENTLIVDIH
jgi:putative spermidine/putrescine transport system ATP-binding protein